MDIYKKVTPPLQAGIAIGLGLVFMLTTLGFEETLAVRPEKPWVFAVTFLIFYIVFNVIFSLGAADAEKYWTQSVIGFVSCLLILSLLAYFISGLGINEAGSFRWIFIVVTICYLVFMGIVRAMKGIVEFAEREEWQQPKLRKKDKKSRRN